jgi:hypothetical protein
VTWLGPDALWHARADLAGPFRDTLGGLFWADAARDRAVLLVVGEDAELVAAARRAVPEGVALEVVPADVPLLALYAIAAAIGTALVDDHAINTLGVDERANRVALTIEPGAQATADRLRARHGDALAIAFGGPATAA